LTGSSSGPAAPCLRNWPRGALANDKNPAAGREALGRSRGGLSTKIHLIADRRCRPITRILSPGQHGDCPRFIPLMEAIRIGRRGKGRPRTRPGAAMGDKAYSSAANRSYLRKRGIKAVIPVKEDQKNHRRNRGSQGGRPPAFDREQYKERNTPGAASASSNSSGLSRPATTSASSCTRAPSTWRQSGSGYEIRSHDPRDTL
jgi:transposase